MGRVHPVLAAPLCKICGSGTSNLGQNLILKKYQISYFSCVSCGFLQTENPYWLEEAYSHAITRQDVGIMRRNLANADITSALITTMCPAMKRGIDFGGGHGVFVRLMRDRGFPFDWFDRHASNDYARGFEFDSSACYDFLTAFEVMEHLVDPIAELSTMMRLAPIVFLSTEVLPEPIPKLSEWWYFSPVSGQHISFYSKGSLQAIARRFGKHLLSCGPFHMFTSEARNPALYRLVTRPKLARLINLFQKRPRLTEVDHKLLSR